jgi:hypothetical protein
MSRKTLRTCGHAFEITRTYLIGKQRITVDGRVVSEKRSLFDLTPHSFSLYEGSADVIYEVDVLSMGFLMGYIVRRNGIIVAHQP